MPSAQLTSKALREHVNALEDLGYTIDRVQRRTGSKHIKVYTRFGKLKEVFIVSVTHGSDKVGRRFKNWLADARRRRNAAHG